MEDGLERHEGFGADFVVADLVDGLLDFVVEVDPALEFGEFVGVDLHVLALEG